MGWDLLFCMSDSVVRINCRNWLFCKMLLGARKEKMEIKHEQLAVFSEVYLVTMKPNNSEGSVQGQYFVILKLHGA